MEIDLFREMHDVTAEVSCAGRNPETMQECEAKGKFRIFGSIQIPLCEPCLMRVCNWRNEKAVNLVAELDRAGALTGDTEGWVYAVRMKNGNVKFGKTTKPNLSRIRSISKHNNGGTLVEVLGVVEGGAGMEALIHSQFSKYRALDRMEEFEPSSEVMEFAESLGFAPELSEPLAKYRQEKKLATFDDWD
jgi:hypothetical protein